MKYHISRVNDADGWIFISATDSFEEPTAFVEMVKKIAESVNGKISSVGDTQYRIANVPHDLIFQWDDLFGIVVINGNTADKDNVLSFLKKYDIE